jgi:hypothetical protein
MYKKMFDIFYDAICDEISVENDLLKRLDKSNFRFTPLRGLKTISLIEKYKINLFVYSVICVIFVFVSPVYFLIKLLKKIAIKKDNKNEIVEENLILVANGRVDYLYNKLNKSEKVTYININQNNKANYISYKKYLKLSDYFLAYIFSLISIFYLLYKLKNKTDILQAYVAFEWFLVYLSLNRLKKGAKKVYFANHYDRWAVMFDQLFKDKEVVLIQHGILPDNLQLDYKLENINTIYYYDDKSKILFKKMFNLNSINFEKLTLSLILSDIKSNKKTILIIGQPHSIDIEIDIISELKNKYEIYVKPHPLFSREKYKSIKDINIIEDRNFYPRVDLALCYESTLGLEYEASGVNVLWWKDYDIKSIYDLVKNKLKDTNA